MASVTNTGITISSTDSLSSGQKIFIANAKEAFEPAAPDPDLISSERMRSDQGISSGTSSHTQGSVTLRL